MRFSDFIVFIGVEAIVMFGISSLLLSIVLIIVCLIVISSTVQFVLKVPNSCTKSHIFIFLFVNIKNPATIFDISVSIANHIPKDTHAINNATSIPITSKIIKTLNIIHIKNKTFHIKFANLFV